MTARRAVTGVVCLGALCVALGGGVLAGTARPQSAILTASVGPGSLRLIDGGGNPVTRVAPGAYTIAVEDGSSVHNVHLEGPGVSRDSGLGFEGRATWTVDFRDGVYTVVSDPQADTLAITIVAGTPLEPRLVARVTDSAIALELADGTPVQQLDPGAYAIRVDDRSRTESFRLIGPGVEQHTQRHVAFETTWLVTLGEGVYHFFSDRRPTALRGSFRVGAASPPEKTTTLTAIAGSDFALALVGSDFAPIDRLEAGTYTIRVDDRSPDHNFRVTGPGVSAGTTLERVGASELTVRLAGGTYSFFCDPHTQTMVGEFRVPAAPAATRRLLGTLFADGRAVLRGPSGAAVTTLPAGAYEIVVRDRSRADGFRLSGPGVRRATTAKFQGTVTWRVRLVRGTYRYGAGRALRSFRVR
jgi:hypothetical protein